MKLDTKFIELDFCFWLEKKNFFNLIKTCIPFHNHETECFYIFCYYLALGMLIFKLI